MQLPMAHVKTMEADNNIEDVDTTETNPVIATREDTVHKKTVIGAEAVVVKPTVILHITVGRTECVPIQSMTSVPQQTDTKSRRCGVTKCWEVKETAPNRSVRYLIVKQM